MAKKKLIIFEIILAFALLLSLVLRLPSLFEFNRYADEDIYLTIGQSLRRGDVLYKDIHDNKPPAIYLLAGLVQTVPHFRLALLLWHFVNVLFIWLLAKKFFRSPLVVGFVTLAFTFFSTIPLLEGNISNGEIFMIMPATIAVYLLWKNKLHFLAGTLFSLAFLFKVPIIFDFVGIVLFFWLFNSKKKSHFRVILDSIRDHRFWFTILGFILPIALSIIYYASKGAFTPYVRSALMQNIGYLSSWSGEAKPLWQSGLVQRGFLLGFFTAILFFLRRRLEKPVLFFLLWLIYALFGALLSERPYPHYLLEPLIPLVFLAGFLFTKFKPLKHLIIIFSFFIFGFSLFAFRFWHYPSIPYYQNFIKYATRQINYDQYLDTFADATANHRLARYIQTHTLPEDKIFVWGTQPSIYAISRRSPVGRYTVAYHIQDFQAYEETMNYFYQDSPQLIIKLDKETLEFPQLDTFLQSRYTLLKRLDSATIYQRL